MATGLERSVFIPIPKKGNARECSNYCTIALISHTSKVMLKILQARLHPRQLFLQGVAAVFMFAFASLYTQIPGEGAESRVPPGGTPPNPGPVTPPHLSARHTAV